MRINSIVRYLLPIMVFAILQSEAVAQCRWDGTAPYCQGSCRGGEDEITQLSSWPGIWTPLIGIQAQNNFGNSCFLGTKALCCHTGRTCRWDGTAPFCDGSCRSDEVRTIPPPGSSSGHTCTTGHKVYCCSKTVSTVAHRTVAIPIVISGAGKCLDVHAPDQRTNGGRVQVWDCNRTLQQTWAADGSRIRSGAGKCLDVHAPDQFTNGAKVQVWDCNGSQQQTWRVEGVRIRSGAGKCLDVHAPDQFNNGGKVQVWDCNGSQQQTWLVP